MAKKFSRITPKRQKTKRILFYKDEKQHIKYEKRFSQGFLRKMKWRQLQSNSERIRFIYISFLKKKIKEGTELNPSETPNEFYNRLLKKNPAQKGDIFVLYNKARYKAAGIDEKDVDSVMHYRYGSTRSIIENIFDFS